MAALNDSLTSFLGPPLSARKSLVENLSTFRRRIAWLCVGAFLVFAAAVITWFAAFVIRAANGLWLEVFQSIVSEGVV